jgi:phage-related protein
MERKQLLPCVFFETESGNQPVREFLLGRIREERKEIGSDIFKVQEGFPMGLPLVEKIDKDLWEIRSHVQDGICRTFFTIHVQTMILLHSFVKKTQKTPIKEIKTATERLREFRRLSL